VGAKGIEERVVRRERELSKRLRGRGQRWGQSGRRQRRRRQRRSWRERLLGWLSRGRARSDEGDEEAQRAKEKRHAVKEN
jgi:hypothetical protein